MLGRYGMGLGVAHMRRLTAAARLLACALTMLACARCGLFGGVQAAAAALFASGMCAGWSCGAMLAGCALGCATLGSMHAAWPMFACMGVWLTLSVAGSVELSPYPSRNRAARYARRACMIARGESGDAARIALAACASGLLNLVMTLAGMSCSTAVYCAMSALMGFGFAPVFAIALGGIRAPDEWVMPARAVLAGVCASGLSGLELGALCPGLLVAAAALGALSPGRQQGRARGRGLAIGGLVGAFMWMADGDWTWALGCAAAGGALSSLGARAGLIACGAILAVTGSAQGAYMAAQRAQCAGQAVLNAALHVLAVGINAAIGLAIGERVGGRNARDTHAVRALYDRCMAVQRARINSQAAHLTADLSELLSSGACDGRSAQCDGAGALSDARRAELMRRIGRLAADAAAHRRSELERLRLDVAASCEVAARLAGYGVELRGACVTADEPRRAYVMFKRGAKLSQLPESVERALTYVTGARFEYESGARGDVLALRQCGDMAVRGAVRRSARGRTECGDSALLVQLGDGRYLAGLSDGMGRGEAAARESHAALAAVARLLDCGIPSEQALDAVNELLLLSGEGEMYATLDIALIDAQTGRADMYKLGALPSVLVSRGSVHMLGAYAPPFGIVERVRAARRSVTLRAGDRLMLMSDGVCDLSDAAQGRELAAQAQRVADLPPGEAAEALIAGMSRAFCGHDDAAVVLIDVETHDATWRGALPGRAVSAANM